MGPLSCRYSYASRRRAPLSCDARRPGIVPATSRRPCAACRKSWRATSPGWAMKSGPHEAFWSCIRFSTSSIRANSLGPPPSPKARPWPPPRRHERRRLRFVACADRSAGQHRRLECLHDVLVLVPPVLDLDEGVLAERRHARCAQVFATISQDLLGAIEGDVDLADLDPRQILFRLALDQVGPVRRAREAQQPHGRGREEAAQDVGRVKIVGLADVAEPGCALVAFQPRKKPIRPMPAAGPMLRMPRTSDAVSSIRSAQYSSSPRRSSRSRRAAEHLALAFFLQAFVGVQDVVPGRLVRQRGPGHQAKARVRGRHVDDGGIDVEGLGRNRSARYRAPTSGRPT